MKRLLCTLCVLALLFPSMCYADPENEEKTVVYTEEMRQKDEAHKEKYRDLAANIKDYACADGFAILGDDETHIRFSKENMQPAIEIPFFLRARMTLFHHEDYREILQLVSDYNSIYASSALSGVYQIFSREHFTTDAIYTEANARTLCLLFSNVMEYADYGDIGAYFGLEISCMEIDGDEAKVVLRRSLNRLNSEGESISPIDTETPEGYVLHKEEDAWKIENVIFAESNYILAEEEAMPVIYEFQHPYGMLEKCMDASTWREAFSFEACQRKNYLADKNFSEYIQGDIAAPVFLYDEWRVDKVL